MRKGEQTRQEIIRRAAPLFNQKGYEGTALSDLMQATGLKKAGSTVTSIASKSWLEKLLSMLGSLPWTPVSKE
jgi:hypothetical protein